MEKFYYGQEEETLTCNDLDEYICAFVDDYEGDLPREIIIGKYSVQDIPEIRFEVLERLLESLDEDYSDPDSPINTKPTEAMKQAEKDFIAVIRKEYRNHWLDPVEKIKVDLLDWCHKNGHEDLFSEEKKPCPSPSQSGSNTLK